MKKVLLITIILIILVTPMYASWWPFSKSQPEKPKQEEKKKLSKEDRHKKKERKKQEYKQKKEVKKIAKQQKQGLREKKQLTEEQSKRQTKSWRKKLWEWVYPSSKRTPANKYEVKAKRKKDTIKISTINQKEPILKREALKPYTIDAKYPYLYKSPAWPFEMLYSKQIDLFQIYFEYNYQKDAYNPSGSSIDISKLIFGEKSFDFEDILLALKLRKKNFFVDNAPARADWSLYRDFYFDKKLLFFGKSEDFNLYLNFARYIHNRDFMFGFKIPLTYKIHRLKLDSTADPLSLNKDTNTIYEEQLPDILNWVLKPKHLNYLPKSSTSGLGNIETFVNFQFKTKYVERFITGIDVSWATIKSADTKKLWAPELGSEFTKISLFVSTLFGRQKGCLQPHMFIKGTYQISGHQDRRVPKYLEHKDPNSDFIVGSGVIARGEMVRYTEHLFKEPDTTVPAFADNVKSVEIRPGPEVELRIGNIFEKIIFKKAYLDLFYNFRAKWSDHINNNGLLKSQWNIDSLKEHTNQIEHKIGVDFSYQFDATTRLQFDFNYAFAGINVPTNLQCALALNTEF